MYMGRFSRAYKHSGIVAPCDETEEPQNCVTDSPSSDINMGLSSEQECRKVDCIWQIYQAPFLQLFSGDLPVVWILEENRFLRLKLPVFGAVFLHISTLSKGPTLKVTESESNLADPLEPLLPPATCCFLATPRFVPALRRCKFLNTILLALLLTPEPFEIILLPGLPLVTILAESLTPLLRIDSGLVQPLALVEFIRAVFWKSLKATTALLS